MPTTVSILNGTGMPLPVTTTVTPGLGSDDWAVTSNTAPPRQSQEVLWMNRDDGITDGKTWVFSSTVQLGGTPVTMMESVTGTAFGSTIQIRATGGGADSGWSTDANVTIKLTGQDGKAYRVTGTYLGNGTGYDNVQYTVSEMILPQIDHVVVLMMENRSLDNLLGYLYTPTDPPARTIPPTAEPSFDGLAYGNHANSDPSVNGGKPVPASCGTTAWTSGSSAVAATAVPTPDPGEEFQHVATQIGNGMGGFLSDYATQVAAAGGPASAAAQIMQSYSPAQLPVISALARSFAVSDAWFSSVPSQTWPNRSFLLAGSSYGQVNNTNHPWKLTTIFDVLGSQNIPWKVFNNGPYPSLVKYLYSDSYWDNEENFGSIEDFGQALNDGTLPPFTFLEPEFGIYKSLIGSDESYHPPYDVRPAEAFLAKVYQMIAASPVAERTLFVLLFDEHGGTYDHVQPPGGAAGTAPYPTADTGNGTYAFDTFGVRVPAIVMSSYVEKGTVFRSTTGVPYDHTSILATIRDWLGLGVAFETQLPSPRIAAAPTLAPVLTAAAPRPWPALDTTGLEQAVAEVKANPLPDSTPLHDQQRAILAAGALMAVGKSPTPADWQTAQAQLKTLGDARALDATLQPHLPLK